MKKINHDIGCQDYHGKLMNRNLKCLFDREEDDYGKTNDENRFINRSSRKL